MKKFKTNIMKTTREVSHLSLYELLPQDALSHDILKARAKIIAVKKQDEIKSENHLGGVCIRLGENNKYAIPFSDVVEVSDAELITPVPQMPEMIAGITNWRGKILTVIHLGKLFGLDVSTDLHLQCVVIVISEGNTLGLLVDDIVGSTTYDPQLLQPPMTMKGMVKQGYMTGLLDGVVGVLNLKTILSDVQGKLNN